MRSIKCETIKRVFKKGAWTREEDMRLITYINRYGIWNWCQMPKYAGLTRSGKSCRLRWINYLRPDVKRGNFTEEEDETIIKLYELLGTRWSVIAAKFPGRTDNEIKNRWHTHLKKRSKEKIWRSMASSSDCMTSNCDYSNQEKIVEANGTPSSGPEAIRADESEVPISSLMLNVGTTETVPRTGEASEIQQTKENSYCSFETSGDPHTSFWREPFSLENSYIEDYDAASVEFELPMLQESTNPYGFGNSDYWFNLLTIADFDGMIDYSNVCF